MDFLSILSAPRVLAWGIQVPQIIEWAVEVIGAVFLLFAVCFAWACCTTHFDFWRVRKVLAQHPSHLTKQNLEDVSDHFEKKIRKLAPLWREFHKTIVPERMGSASANVFATRPAEEFFPVPTLVDHRIGASIYLAVPGVMTSLGLLGTFLALFSGLTGLRVEASGQVTGIQGFITGLSGKFVSSIVGLISAILSLVIVRYFLAGMHDTATALQTTLNKAFQRKPQEMILNEMLRQLEDQSSAYKSFSADLAGEIKSSFNTDIARLGDKLTETLERLNVNISRQGDSFRSFADAFADTLRGSLKDGMQPGIETLQKSLTELAVATEELKKHSAESSQDTMEKMLAQFQKSLTVSVAI